ncbi:hypothetical protein FRC06_001040 [Ceratobasidium sp. 370]|nr:hypothetical protein FRC06_001040 [Ceratobasidium sp. 370]
MCRFLEYAKFIKHLELENYEHSDVNFVKNSHALLKYAETNVLLPKIQSLSIESYYNPSSTFDWAVGLFSNSLVELRCKPTPDVLPPLSLEATLHWLESIPSRCPNLETLEIYPYSDWGDEIFEWVHEYDHSIQDRFSKPLRLLTQLRSLHFNTFLTTPDLMLALASLPKLEQLEICNGRHLELIVSSPNLTPDSFPALRHLKLRDLQDKDFHNIWNTKFLIRNLVSLHLVFNPLPNHEWPSIRFRSLVRLLPPPHKLSQLTRLVIDIEILGNGHSKILDNSDLEAISSLPLEYVFIRGAQVDPNGSEGKSPCEILAGMWPSIQELHWLDQPATSRDLVYFAALTCLRLLTLNVKLMPAPKDVDDAIAGPDTFRVLECSKPKPFRSTPESRKQLARQVPISTPTLAYLT